MQSSVCENKFLNDTEMEIYNDIIENISQYTGKRDIIAISNISFREFLKKEVAKFDDVAQISSANVQLTINLTNFTWFCNQDFLDNRRNSRENFIIIPVSLIAPNISHQNIILVDKKNKIWEYFEPYGSISETNAITISENKTPLIPIGIDYTVESTVHEVLKKLFPDFKNFSFHNVLTRSTHPIAQLGFQTFGECIRGKGDGKKIIGGYCVAWCLLYVYVRLHFLNKSYSFTIDAISTNLQHSVNVYGINYKRKTPGHDLLIESFIRKIHNELEEINISSNDPMFIEQTYTTSDTIFKIYDLPQQIEIVKYIRGLLIAYLNSVQRGLVQDAIFYKNKLSVFEGLGGVYHTLYADVSRDILTLKNS